MTDLVDLRSHVKAPLLERGVKFSYMPVIIKAVSMALHHHPRLNSHTSSDCTTIINKADHNIGVAMDTPEGLIVPNIKRCQVGKTLLMLDSRKISDLDIQVALSVSFFWTVDLEPRSLELRIPSGAHEPPKAAKDRPT